MCQDSGQGPHEIDARSSRDQGLRQTESDPQGQLVSIDRPGQLTVVASSGEAGDVDGFRGCAVASGRAHYPVHLKGRSLNVVEGVGGRDRLLERRIVAAPSDHRTLRDYLELIHARIICTDSRT